MPNGSSMYGASRSSYLASRRAARASAVQKARTTVTKAPKSTRFNAPVYRKLRKPRRTTKVARNKGAIMTLARQVKTLQQQRFGELQSHTQYCNLTGSNLPTPSQPLAFVLNNFYDQPIYKGAVITGTGIQGIASFTVGPTIERQTYQTDLDDIFEWNARRNTDEVSLVEYKPVYTRLKLVFRYTMPGNGFPAMARVTVIKVKAYQSSNKLNVTIPGALGAYRNLANREFDPQRNYFDKRYHTVLYDKWVKTTFTNDSNVTDLLSREVTISWKYKDMVHKPDITNNPTGQSFWTNVPQREVLWVLISAGDHSDRLSSLEIGKFDTWRDPHGV